MNAPLQISEFISLRRLAEELDIDRKAVAAVVKRFGIPVVTHPSLPNAKLLGVAEAEAVRRILTPRKRKEAV